MFLRLIQYIKSCFCKHEMECLYEHHNAFMYKAVYRCTKCGFVQTIDN